jgi:hypothetical protein
MPLYHEVRKRYIPPLAKGVATLGVGDLELCRQTAGPKGQKYRWREELRSGRTAFKDVFVVPTEYQAPPAHLPAVLAGITEITRLTVPYNYLPRLADQPWLESLVGLTVGGERIPASAFDPTWTWPKIVLPKLRTLRFMAGAESLWPRLGLTGEYFPGLAALEAPVAGKTGLQRISSFDHLVFAEIVAVSNHDVFAALPTSLQALCVNTSGPKFPFAALPGLEQLTALALTNIRAEIDCGIFRDLPNLAELTILHSSKLTDIGALLDAPGLTALELYNAKSPVPAEIRGELRKHIRNLSIGP